MSLNSFSPRFLLSVYYAPGSTGVSGQQTGYCRPLKLVEKDIEGLNARNAWEVEGSGISQRKSPLRALRLRKPRRAEGGSPGPPARGLPAKPPPAPGVAALKLQQKELGAGPVRWPPSGKGVGPGRGLPSDSR